MLQWTYETHSFNIYFWRILWTRPYAGHCWGQRDDRDSLDFVLMELTVQWGRQTCHKRVTIQSGQGWGKGPRGAVEAQVGCLIQLEGQGGLPGVRGFWTESSNGTVCPSCSDLSHVSLWSVRGAFQWQTTENSTTSGLSRLEFVFLTDQKYLQEAIALATA